MSEISPVELGETYLVSVVDTPHMARGRADRLAPSVPTLVGLAGGLLLVLLYAGLGTLPQSAEELLAVTAVAGTLTGAVTAAANHRFAGRLSRRDHARTLVLVLALPVFVAVVVVTLGAAGVFGMFEAIAGLEQAASTGGPVAAFTGLLGIALLILGLVLLLAVLVLAVLAAIVVQFTTVVGYGVVYLALERVSDADPPAPPD